MFDLKKYLILLENSASHGLEIDNMMVLVHWLMLLLFIGWGAFYHHAAELIMLFCSLGFNLSSKLMILNFSCVKWHKVN